MIIDASTKIQDLLIQDARIREALEHLGIDPRCGSKRVLDAAREIGIFPAEIRSALKNALRHSIPALALVRKWRTARTDEVVDFILQTHHASLRRKLPALEALFHTAALAAKERHSSLLAAVRHIFTTLRAHLEQHLPQEEQIVFPRLRNLETPSSCIAASAVSFDAVRHALARMEQEHETVGNALLDMRAATDGYIPPPDARSVFTSLYDGLRNLEHDLREHIFLENNVLFPKALRHFPQPFPKAFSE